MFTMLPPPRSSMPGSTARMERYIAFTLRSKAASQSSSEHARMLPWCTYPAQLKRTSNGPRAVTRSCTAAAPRTSSTAVERRGSSAASAASAFSSMSVASARAPSCANANAVARPIPCPAAVNSAVLPASRPLIELAPRDACDACSVQPFQRSTRTPGRRPTIQPQGPGAISGGRRAVGAAPAMSTTFKLHYHSRCEHGADGAAPSREKGNGACCATTVLTPRTPAGIGAGQDGRP